MGAKSDRPWNAYWISYLVQLVGIAHGMFRPAKMESLHFGSLLRVFLAMLLYLEDLFASPHFTDVNFGNSPRP